MSCFDIGVSSSDNTPQSSLDRSRDSNAFKQNEKDAVGVLNSR